MATNIWQWMVQTGLIKGDPNYYSTGKAAPEEYKHALQVAMDAAKGDASGELWNQLVQVGAIKGDPKYYSSGQAQPEEFAHALNVASDFFVQNKGAGSTSTSGGTANAGGVTVKSGAPSQEKQAKTGVGRDDKNPDTPDLKILTGKEMKWFFDKNNGKWYVEYGLPNSNRSALFEAEPDQMDALFGKGFRPISYTNSTLKSLTQREGVTFSGNLAEMAGTGSFEDKVERVTTLALDEGKLPDWALQDGAAMDIIYTAQSEGKSDEWVLDQLSKTAGFKQRFPNIEQIRTSGNLSLGEAVSGYLEFEAGVNNAVKTMTPGQNVTPETVGALLKAGHSLTTVTDTVANFRRAQKYQPALEAFNKVLVAAGEQPITELQDVLDFVSGNAASHVYDMYEASSIQEAASAAGLGSVFSSQDAIQAAYAGAHTLESASAGMRKASELLLRLRHEVDTGKFGLNTEDLIDLSLGQAPRSGLPESEIMENVNRAVLSAQESLQKRSSSFKQFGTEGQVQSSSLRGLRQEQ